ncbi:MAG: hypothetical protein JW860_03675 [Sedimentisphaerales bacterium]|nr:hypothetical protein [Sedimentisphaerales bacterium]
MSDGSDISDISDLMDGMYLYGRTRAYTDTGQVRGGERCEGVKSEKSGKGMKRIECEGGYGLWDMG